MQCSIVKVVCVCCSMLFLGQGLCFAEDPMDITREVISTLIIQYQVTGDRQKGSEEVYWQEDKICVLQNMSLYFASQDMWKSFQAKNMMKEGFLYRMDMDAMQGIKTVISPSSATDPMMTMLGLKVFFTPSEQARCMGRERILGYLCTIYEEPLLGKIWAWEGIILKIENTNRGNLRKEAVALRRNVTIAQEIFDVPEGMHMQEIASSFSPHTGENQTSSEETP